MVDPLEGLNDSQKEAVKQLDQPLLVFAGPGTGKTKVVTRKLAYLIKEKNFKPDQVLALTFSNKATQEMESRISELLPSIANLQISTFHSFCNEVVSENALELGINPNSPVFTDEYQQAYFLDHLDELGIEEFEIPTRPIELAQTFANTIARFKQENISVDSLDAYLKSNKKGDAEVLGKLKDLAKAFRAIEAFKSSKGLIDFADMQMLTLKLFEEKPEILKRYQERFKYIIVDEFQDTDFIQLKILFKLAPNGNITVVGDDDQSIYRFRGAYLTNIHEFDEHYKQTGHKPERIVLDINYRCTGNIQKIATRLIRANTEREQKKIKTDKPDGSPVHVINYDSDLGQAAGIANKILALHEKEVPWDHMAILVRRRIDSEPISEALTRAGIPFEMLGSRKYFQEPIIRAVVAYLKVLHDPEQNQPSLGLILLRPRHGILPGETANVARYAKDKDLSLWAALGDLEAYGGSKNALQAFRKEMDRLFAIMGEGGLLETVRAVLFTKDLFGFEISRKDMKNIGLLNRFLEISAEFLRVYPEAGLGEFLNHLQALADLGIDEETAEPTAGKVHLLTVHGSKGMEFPHVFLPCLSKNRFPSRYKGYKIDIPTELADGLATKGTPEDLHLQEERRLLYVGISRGIEDVYLSHCKRFGDNKTDSPPSIFLDEIIHDKTGLNVENVTGNIDAPELVSNNLEEALRRHINVNIERGDWQEALDAITVLAQEKGLDSSGLTIKGDLKPKVFAEKLKIIEEQPAEDHLKNAIYSPSKLKAYDDCPRKYWFQYVLNIPGEVRTFFELGTLVHGVIEEISKRLMENQTITEKEALAILDASWVPSVYETKQKERQDRADAEEMIKMFLKHQASRTGKILEIESWVEFELEGRKFHGRVDRIDDLGECLEVIDYKSSKNKTPKPKLKEDFQVGLYKIGVETSKQKTVARVGHWYLRMDEENMIELNKTELASIKKRMVDIVKAIEEKKFENKPGYQTCQYCDYSELCDEK